MGQQVADADDRFASVRQSRPEIRQPSRHGVVEPDLAFLDEPHRSDGDDRLGDRGKPEDGILAHRQTLPAIGKTGGATMDDLSVARDKHDRSDQPLFIEGICDCGVNSRAKGYMPVGLCLFEGKTHQIKPSIITTTVPEYSASP